MFYRLSNKQTKLLSIHRKERDKYGRDESRSAYYSNKKIINGCLYKINSKKDFKDITIKDITDEATVNRATFYSHFQDKYDLMDAVITEDILESIVKHLNHYDRLNEETIESIFFTLTKFHTKKRTEYLSQCRRSMESFNSIIEQKIKKELGELFYSLLFKTTT